MNPMRLPRPAPSEPCSQSFSQSPARLRRFQAHRLRTLIKSQTEAASAGTHIHILPFAGTGAIVLRATAASASWIQARTAITP